MLQASVIVPIRNEMNYIDKCLSSLADQSISKDKYEVIVVDGMSTDDTPKIISQYCNKYSNFQTLSNPDMIVPYALNSGIERAKSDLIIRVDGHCYVDRDFIELCIQYSQVKDVACVGGIILSINNSFTGRVIALGMSSKFGVGNVTFRLGSKERFVDTLAFGAYKREVFDQIGNFDTDLIRCQDDEFNYRLRKSGGKIFLTPLIKVYYYPRTNLIKLFKQYFQYGFWKVRVLQKHPRMMQPRQFIPVLFVLSLLITGIGQIFFNSLHIFFCLIGLSYITANIISSLYLSIKNGLSIFFLLPVVYIILHISYGIGFITGLIVFIRRWKNKQ